MIDATSVPLSPANRDAVAFGLGAIVGPMAVIKTPPGTANLVARRIDESGLSGVAGTVAGDDTIIVVLRQRGAGRALKELLSGG